MVIIGIDPGKKGGAVALDLTGKVVSWIAADDPDGGYMSGKDYVAPAMSGWLRDVASLGVVLVLIEQQQAMPMEGRTSCLTTGFGWGLWVGAVGALSLPMEHVRSNRWARALFGQGAKDRKARSVRHASERLPDLPLVLPRRRRPHDGLADAGCIALFGLSQLAMRGS